MSNAIGSSRESNPSLRICNLIRGTAKLCRLLAGRVKSILSHPTNLRQLKGGDLAFQHLGLLETAEAELGPVIVELRWACPSMLENYAMGIGYAVRIKTTMVPACGEKSQRS